MYELSPTVKAAADAASGGASFDVDKWALDYMLQQMFRNQLDANEDSTPIVNHVIAKIAANSVSGWGV